MDSGFKALGIVVVFGILLACGLQLVNVTFFDNVPMEVWVDNEIVYKGISAGVNISSTGDTTRVDVHGGFLYFFPKAYYVSDNVKAIGIKQAKEAK